MKHTKGKVQVSRDGRSVWSTNKNTFKMAICDSTHVYEEEAEANAELIAEAFNVTNESGLTPSELLKQRNELLETLKEISEAKGRYSMDILTHASNTIEDMVNLAKQAIKNAKIQ